MTWVSEGNLIHGIINNKFSGIKFIRPLSHLNLETSSMRIKIDNPSYMGIVSIGDGFYYRLSMITMEFELFHESWGYNVSYCYSFYKEAFKDGYISFLPYVTNFFKSYLPQEISVKIYHPTSHDSPVPTSPHCLIDTDKWVSHSYKINKLCGLYNVNDVIVSNNQLSSGAMDPRIVPTALKSLDSALHKFTNVLPKRFTFSLFYTAYYQPGIELNISFIDKETDELIIYRMYGSDSENVLILTPIYNGLSSTINRDSSSSGTITCRIPYSGIKGMVSESIEKRIKLNKKLARRLDNEWKKMGKFFIFNS